RIRPRQHADREVRHARMQLRDVACRIRAQPRPRLSRPLVARSDLHEHVAGQLLCWRMRRELPQPVACDDGVALVELLLAAVAPRTVIADARVPAVHDIEYDTTRAPGLPHLAAAERISLAAPPHA